MVEKKLKRLSRADLIELLLEQTRRVEELEEQLQLANEQLSDKALKITEAGSIAQASLQLNSVFETAQAAAEQYLYNIKLLNSEQEELCARYRAACVAVLLYACKRCRTIEKEAKRRRDRMLAIAKVDADKIREQAVSGAKDFTSSSTDKSTDPEGVKNEQA